MSTNRSKTDKKVAGEVREKVRYTDEELQEFKELIHEKLAQAELTMKS